MISCPVCGSNCVVRSRTRIGLERFRRQFTAKRPYRCYNCKWRGWMAEDAQASSPNGAFDAANPAADQGAINATLDRITKKSDARSR